ncbi:energy transducer TonB [Mucilaginibacter sp. BJC16-A38]|uniref:energy transducer TonB n=1 Tax=Mucilaginibacter phenanthrenivorans TaxID=1234842 RepID=UPI002157374F|nr:energy transducer TonB [Mucilaginibacter phenanthrenivorans]MCR8561885.1 energy transducer TonB [Mucilaginibacter phenanthrenivorans]
MIKAGLILFISITFAPQFLIAQYTISLNRSNVVHYKHSYLINIPDNPHVERLYINDQEGLIPADAYHHPWHQEYPYKLDRIFISKPASGYRPFTRRKSAHSYNFDEYKIYINANMFSGIDSLSGIDDSLLTYKPFPKTRPEINEKSELIYYFEFSGSPCCYIDNRHYHKIPITDFIKTFEAMHHVKIGKWYHYTYGDEGETTLYFTLSGLTPKQKIQFIDERHVSLMPDEDKVDPINFMGIYRPVRIALTSLVPPYYDVEKRKKADEMKIYTSVETPPEFPDGIEQFKAQFKCITVSQGEPELVVVSFVVEKDGSLADIRLVRGGDDGIKAQIVDIIKGSKKWKPGIQGGRIVRVNWAVAIKLGKKL